MTRCIEISGKTESVDKLLRIIYAIEMEEVFEDININELYHYEWGIMYFATNAKSINVWKQEGDTFTFSHTEKLDDEGMVLKEKEEEEWKLSKHILMCISK